MVPHFDFEWQFMQSHTHGYSRRAVLRPRVVRDDGPNRRNCLSAQESYNLYVVPATLLLNYRFGIPDNRHGSSLLTVERISEWENRDDGKRYFAALRLRSVAVCISR